MHSRGEGMNRESAAASRRRALPWILLGSVALVIAGVTLYRVYAPGPPDDPSSTAGEAVARAPVRRLTPGQVRALAQRSPGIGGPSTAADMAAMAEKRKRMAEATQARIRQRNTQMAERFSAEKTDPAWSGAHERELMSLQDAGPMRDAGIKPADLHAECRSSMCRIQGDFPDAGAASDWLQLYMASVGDRLPVATVHQVRNPDGSMRVEIYGIGRK